MVNNYAKVVQRRIIEGIYFFDDGDPDSRMMAINRATCKKASLDKAKVVVWRIPHEATEVPIYRQVKSVNHCPDWAHQWRPSGGRIKGNCCERCGYYDSKGYLAESQQMKTDVKLALSELDKD